MITTIKGDVLDSTNGFIIHGCNKLGIMGSGVARGVKARFPAAYDVYKASCDTAESALGQLTIAVITPQLFIVNAITQQSMGSGLQVSYKAIEDAFRKLNEIAKIFDPMYTLPFCFPMIGAGRGGGSWPLIEQTITQSVDPKRALHLYVVELEPDYCH